MKPKRIEWVDGKNGAVGIINKKAFARIYTAINSDMWFYEFHGETGTYYPDMAAAKAACQSAFDAWVMQFMETAKD